MEWTSFKKDPAYVPERGTPILIQIQNNVRPYIEYAAVIYEGHKRFKHMTNQTPINGTPIAWTKITPYTGE